MACSVWASILKRWSVCQVAMATSSRPFSLHNNNEIQNQFYITMQFPPMKDLRFCKSDIPIRVKLYSKYHPFLYNVCIPLISTPDTGHKLTELYIRRNQLSDFSELDHLTSLPNLTVSV